MSNKTTTLIRKGSTGEAVKTMQKMLIACGYNCVGVDGDFGKNTLNALVAFQEDHDLDPDGVYGPLSKAALEKAYSSAEKTTAQTSAQHTVKGLQAKDLKNLSEAEVVKKVGPLFTADQKKSGILACVSMAQFILESGYGKTDLAQGANNCFGMKKTLSGNTWSDSTWDGKSIYTKKTQEDDGKGNLYTITAAFRKYPCVEDSIADHSAYLLDAKNGSALRYAGLKGCTDYKKAIQIIKDGGYATDTKYVSKTCDIISRWDLTQFNAAITDTMADYSERKIIDITKENLSEVPASRGSNKIEFIVVHYLGVPNADNPYLYGGGYGGHFNIKRDGSIYKAADPKTSVVWHCGGGLQGSGGHTFHRICTNYNSIGIECGVCYTENVKDADGDSNQWYFTTETQESLVWLVAKLMKEYGISLDHVIRHYDVTGKCCPNPYVKNNKLRTSWTWDEFKAKVKAQVNGTAADTMKMQETPAADKVVPDPGLTVPEIKYYRVRKSWDDKSSQIGAFTVLENSKLCVDANPGYAAFDEAGKKIYPEKKVSDFTKYTLTETQLLQIARLCQQEQGSVAGAKAEASLMANQLETDTSRQKEYGTGVKGLYNWVRNGGWFANAKHFMDNGSVTKAVLEGVKDVLVNGNRTLPLYVDEHDCLSDIKSISTGAVKDRDAYVQGRTIVKNKHGSTYTFWCFPDKNSDPFGYTSEAYRAVNGANDADGAKGTGFFPYNVEVSIPDLNCRKGPSVSYESWGYIEPGVYVIVDEQDGWGLLEDYEKSRNGWIKLNYTTRV